MKDYVINLGYFRVSENILPGYCKSTGMYM